MDESKETLDANLIKLVSRIENKSKVPKWKDYFMDMAFLVAQRSLDPATKHGCVVVDDENTILSIGYNSPPRGCMDADIPIERPQKYSFFVHAEEAAMLNAARIGVSLKNSTFYITGYPCPRCFRGILNVGAKRIIYGPVNSNCITEEDKQDIHLMNLVEHNRDHTVNVEKIDFEQYIGNIGSVIKKTIEYLENKCQIKV